MPGSRAESGDWHSPSVSKDLGRLGSAMSLPILGADFLIIILHFISYGLEVNCSYSISMAEIEELLLATLPISVFHETTQTISN